MRNARGVYTVYVSVLYTYDDLACGIHLVFVFIVCVFNKYSVYTQRGCAVTTYNQVRAHTIP